MMKLQFSYKMKLRVVKTSNNKEKTNTKNDVNNLIYLREPTNDAAPYQRRPSLSDSNLGHLH
jgi:hypothetical protein